MSIGNRRRAPQPGGVGEYFLPYGEVVTIETATCRHCQAIIECTPRAKSMLPTCNRCHSIVCPMCKADDICIPYEKRCELEEGVARQTGESCNEEIIAREAETRRLLQRLGIRT